VVSNSIGETLTPQASYQQPQQLPQYVPAYREPVTYAPAPAYPTPPPRVHQVAFQPAPQAQQYYTYYPASGYNPGLNTIFEQMQCFSGEMEVETPSGMKAIKDLEVGDMVLSVDEFMVTFSPVIMFLHKLEDERAVFLHIHTEHGESLKLTENHLLYLTNCGSADPLQLAAAKDARAGQCLQVTTGNSDLIPRRITSISKVIENGIYAPLTTTGDIIVNRYLVSCHSNLALKTLQQTFFSVYRSLSNLFRNFVPTYVHDVQIHLPAGVHYLTTVADMFLPNSLL
ncbi:intein splicing region, partial [Cooperia oncophora]